MDYLNRENITVQRINHHATPYYSPKKDLISIPDRPLYKNNDEFYMTLFHEVIHSTGHPRRLNRFEVGGGVFGSQDYSLEELVAEIGANYLSAETSINPDFMNSVGYIKGWVSKLKEHPRWIVSAAARAEKAVGFVLR
jgi:antirestriction protein ArdC